jgi:hypothetical protein
MYTKESGWSERFFWLKNSWDRIGLDRQNLYGSLPAFFLRISEEIQFEDGGRGYGMLSIKNEIKNLAGKRLLNGFSEK